jgi:preprotein translocase subunit SecG
MVTLMTVLIALVCVLLMAAVLIQNPKGGGVDSTFGGQSANQMFGAAKSTDFIEKITWGLAALLMILCIFTTFLVTV